MKKQNSDSEKVFANQQSNTGDNNTNIMNNLKILSLFFPCNLWTSLNLSSSAHDAKLVENENFFKWYYGVSLNPIQRKHVIEYKNTFLVTREIMKLGLKTQQIKTTNDGIKIELRREMPIIGNILALILLLIISCSILSFHPASGLPKDLVIGYLLYIAYSWGTAYYLRKFLIDPVRKLEKSGLKDSFFAASP